MNTFNISVNKTNGNINVVITDNDSNILIKDSSEEVDKDELFEEYLNKNIPKYGEMIRKKYSIKGIIFFHI